MQFNLKKHVKPKTFRDEEKTRTARILYIIVSVTIIILMCLSIVSFLPGIESGINKFTLALYLAGAVSAFVLMQCGYVYYASLLITYGMWGRAVALLFGLYDVPLLDTGVGNFYLAVICGGLLLGRISLIVISSVTYAAWLLIYSLEARELLMFHAEPVMTIHDMVNYTIILAVLTFLLYKLKKRQQAENALEKSRKMFQIVLDNIPQFVFWKDRQSVYLGCNRNFARAAGLHDPSEIPGKTDYDLAWKEEEADWYIGYDRKIMESDQPELHIIEPQLMAGGKEAWLETNKIPLHDAYDNVIGILGTYEDITERREAERKLRESEEKYRTLLENLNVGIFRTRVDSRDKLIHANIEMARMLGYDSVEELLTVPISASYSDPEYRNVFIDEIRENGFVRNMELTLKRKDGSEIIVRESACAVFDDEGGIKWIDGVIEDITRRKNIESALKASEEKLRTVIGNLPVILWSINNGGIVTLMDGQKIELSGVASEDIVGRSYTEVFQNYPQVEKNIRNAFDGNMFTTIEEIEGRFLETWYTPVKDDSGIVMEVTCLSTDITKRHDAEAALLISEQNYRNLFENASDAILIFDLKTEEVIETNSRALRIYGYNRDEFIGKNLNDITMDNVSGVQWLERVCEEINVRNYEAVHLDKHGKPIDFLINASITEYKGKTVVMSYNRDVTEHKRLLDQFHRSQKIESLGKMAGAVAHDLNHILTGLVTYPDLILLDMAIDDPLRRKIETIKNSGKRAAAVVEDLMTVSRGGLAAPEIINMNDIIRECIKTPEIRQLVANYGNVIIDTALDDSLRNISCAHVKILKIMNNLINNAFEAMPNGGRLLISTHNKDLPKMLKAYEDIEKGKYAVLCLSDAGVGIRREDMKYIFDPYYTRKLFGTTGSGIGLTVVWNIVKDNGGYINVKSEVGAGTVFELYFPVSEEQSSEGQHVHILEEYMGRGETVLIVEDEENQRTLTENVLERLNYRSESVACGEDALQYVIGRPVDIILLDLYLGEGWDGLDTYNEIIRKKPDQKIIFISGFPESDRFKKARSKKEIKLITKPFTIGELGAAIRDTLRMRDAND